MQQDRDVPVSAGEAFPTDPAGLPEATGPALLELSDGEVLELQVGAVAKRLGDDTVRMLGYNGSIPGPTLKVGQGSEIVVHVVNDGDLDTTVHWHGLRLENRYDGVPHETQAPIPVGGEFTYRIQFPDPGLYWYHPHIREDYTQEMGLYGNIVVVPAEPDYWPPADRELVLTLDDILLEDGRVAPFSPSETTYAAMGRYGNLMLVGGQTHYHATARAGQVLRLWLTNTANTRVFNVRLPGARMKLVGGDSGRVERAEFVEEVLLAPSERAIVDVLVDRPGELTLEHRTPDRSYPLATISVADEPAAPSATSAASATTSAAAEFEVLREAPELAAERRSLDAWLAAAPDKTLALVAEMDDPAAAAGGPVVYACPMHPEVTSDQPDRCPECGMKLLATAAAVTYACPMHPEVTSDRPDRCPKCGMKLLAARTTADAGADHGPEMHHSGHDASGQHSTGADMDDHAGHEAPHSHGSGQHRHGADMDGADMDGHPGHEAPHSHGSGPAGGIEWEDDMVAVNRQTTAATMHWMFVDRTPGAPETGIDWRFTVGDRVKVRLVNEMDSDHPMHHPFHLHGAGRFLVLARDGQVESNLVWKDTVLIRTGQTVDILFDVSNPGLWMAHCHIAEHMHSGMMFSFTVARQGATP